MKKTLILVIIALACSACTKQKHSRSWTEHYYKTMYDSLYTVNGSVIKNDEQRKSFTDYEINRLKTVLPEGFSSVSEDSLGKLFTKMGDDYAKTHNTDNLQATLPWSAQTEQSFRASILNTDYMKKMDKTTRAKLCDCFITQLKVIYPDSLRTPIPDSIYTEVVNRCSDMIPAAKGK